jgi:hypothetical protein
MAGTASAGLVTFNLDQSAMSSPPGGIYQPAACQNLDGSGACVIFTGEIVFTNDQLYTLTGLQLSMSPSNPDGGGVDVLDNNNENYFFDNVPGSLGLGSPAGDGYSGGIFEVDVEPAAPEGNYFGMATLQYQDGSGNPFSSTVNFEVMVPEPGMFPLAASGLAAICGLLLRRRPSRV